MTTAVQKNSSQAQRVQEDKRKRTIGQIVIEILKYSILIPLATSFIFPIYWMFSSALKDDPQVFTIPPVLVPNPAFWENFINAWNLLPFNTFTYNTLFRFVIPVTIITVISSTVVAYGFAKIPWRGREYVFWLVLLTLMLPWAVKMVPVFITLKALDWLDTYKFWAVTALFGHPYFIFMLRQFFRSIPEDLSEAARIDGANELTILFRIILPLSKPALAVVALFRFLWAWNDYLGPKLFIRTQENYPLALGIDLLNTRANDVGTCVRCLPYLMAVSAMVALPVIIAFFFAQRTFIEGINLTGTKG
ncbi:MAG: carbohydrate ABC transporter permease [Anaerolineales bacterium]|nr:carbohydrate ABC transporter permease [Anaerolineales bacterium]